MTGKDLAEQLLGRPVVDVLGIHAVTVVQGSIKFDFTKPLFLPGTYTVTASMPRKPRTAHVRQ